MKDQIHIPQPCSADWAAMSHNAQGRHCALCVKTVVDFSKMTDEQVIDYLKASTAQQQKVCGNFRPDQVTAPKPRIPIWGRWAAALAGLGFLLGACAKPGNGRHERLAGAVAYFPPDTTDQQAEPADSVRVNPDVYHIRGEVYRIPGPGALD